MSKYYIYAVLLNSCPYSERAYDLLQMHGIEHQVKIVSREEKEKFKLENFETYPQIFLKKENSVDSLFLGGFSDLNDIFNTFKSKKYNEQSINNFQNKYNWWSKKAILRLIQLINKKKIN